MCSLPKGDALSLPKGWEVKKLGEVCEVFNGLWKGKKPPYIEVGVIRNTNFTKNGCLDDSNIAFLPVEIRQFEKRKLQYGDIILEKSGGGPKQPVGRVVLFNKHKGDFSFSNFTSVIRIFNKEILEFNFLHKFLFFLHISGKTEPMQRRSTGIRNLQLNEYKGVQIPLPPLPEQKRIVAILEKAFTAIDQAKANTEKNLKNARELFQSKLQETFANGKLKIESGEWEEKKLGEVCQYDKNKNTRTDLPYVGLENIESNTGKFIGSKKPSQVKSSTFYFSSQHILYGRLRPYLNKVLLPDFSGHCSTEIFPIKANKLTVREFLFYWFMMDATVSKINATWTGARMPRANMKEVINFYIGIPPLPEQKRIVKKLDVVSTETKKLEAIYQRKITCLDELKKSILQKAFNGEL